MSSSKVNITYIKEYRKMNEENKKIAKIKKSCNAGKTVSIILCIVAIVACVAALVGGIVILKMGKTFDNTVQQAIDEGKINQSDSILTVNGINLNTGSIPTTLESDIPAVQEAMDDHPLSVMYGCYALVCALAAAVVAVMMRLVCSIFELIIKEDSPFTDKVRKKVTGVLIVTAAILCLTAGLGFGALCGLIAWVVYNVLDYGKTLQIQSDETL